MVRANMSPLVRHLTLAIATLAASPVWAQAPETTTSTATAQQPATDPAQQPATDPAQQPVTDPAQQPATDPAQQPPIDQTAQPAPAEPAPEAKPAPKSPYSMPFQLRGAAPATLLRVDTAVAFFQSGADAEPTYASFITAGYKFSDNFGAFVRIGMIDGSLPTQERRGTAMSNPAIGGVVATNITENVRFAGYLSATIPVGDGAGDTPNELAKSARQAGILARSQMDNTILANNDFGIMPGIDIAYVNNGVTLQGELTFNGAFRVRGEKDQPESSKLNLTMGLHFGFFMADWISFGSEVRYQHWLKPPPGVENDPRPGIRGQGSVAMGPRLHIKTGDATVRPGIAYTVGFDDPMASLNYSIIFIDVPVTF